MCCIIDLFFNICVCFPLLYGKDKKHSGVFSSAAMMQTNCFVPSHVYLLQTNMTHVLTPLKTTTYKIAGNGERDGREDDGHARGSCDLARGRRGLVLVGSRRGPNPVTRWPGLAPTEDANKNGGLGDAEEHVQVELEGDTNEEGNGNGGASGANGTLRRKRRWYQLHEKHTVYAMVLERTEAGVLSRSLSDRTLGL